MKAVDFKEASGLTDEKIASLLGVHRPSWSRWKHSQCHPAGRILELALDMLFINIQEGRVDLGEKTEGPEDGITGVGEDGSSVTND